MKMISSNHSNDNIDNNNNSNNDNFFHEVCPYTVPYYPPRFEGQAQEDYYRWMP
jgi:hypothetical protein